MVTVTISPQSKTVSVGTINLGPHVPYRGCVTPWMMGQRGSRHRAGGEEGGVVGVVRDRGQSSPGWTIAYDG
jgi:hypothetical protein